MESGFEPRVLICCDCGEEFVFTAGAQEYFAERGFSEDPKRCKSCHTAYKKNQRLPHQPPTSAAYQQSDYRSPD